MTSWTLEYSSSLLVINSLELLFLVQQTFLEVLYSLTKTIGILRGLVGVASGGGTKRIITPRNYHVTWPSRIIAASLSVVLLGKLETSFSGGYDLDKYRASQSDCDIDAHLDNLEFKTWTGINILVAQDIELSFACRLFCMTFTIGISSKF